MDRQKIFTVNRFGRKTEDLPALKEMHTLFLMDTSLPSFDTLAEMYGVDENGKPVSLPNFIHMLKGSDVSLQNRIHLGLFDFITAIRDSHVKLAMLEKIFNGKLCHVLPWIIPTNYAMLEGYYEDKIREGWEGLVIRVNGDTYKAKPNRDVDAVIIGINKNTKGFEKGLAKSVKVALLQDDGHFVELGDATVPSEDEARELFALTRVKVRETDAVVFVRPLVVVTISYISLFPDTVNQVYAGESLLNIGTTMLVRMKSPRVVGYRKDKKVCAQDVGLNQIGE